MSSPTQSAGESSTSDIIFATVIFVVCLIVLAFTLHAFRSRRYHHGFAVVGVERLMPLSPPAFVTLRR